MFDWWKNRAQDRARAQKLYGAVVTLARTPSFYSEFGIPDTPEGRFEMVALALFLVLERLKSSSRSQGLIQTAIEAFVTDMDDCMREMGVGDLVVPKRVKRAAAAFYERSGDYRTPLAAKDAAGLAQALGRHAFAGAGQPEQALKLARLVLQFDAALAAEPDDSILEGSALAWSHLAPAAGAGQRPSNAS